MDPVVSALRAASSTIGRAPYPVANNLGRGVALAAARRSPQARRVVARNLRRIKGDQPDRLIRQREVQQVFDSYARYWVDVLRLPHMSPNAVERGFKTEGYEYIEEACENGTAPIVGMPHLGGWEWATPWMVGRGYEVSAVVEELDSVEMYEWFREFREGLGVNVIPLDSRASTELASAIAQGHVICLLCDRDISGAGVEVEFFGEVTRLPGGPALMALRTGAPLLPGAIYFEGSGCRGVIRPPLDTERRGKLREDVQRVTQDMAKELEILIRRAPLQWHLLQPNWPSDYEALGMDPP